VRKWAGRFKGIGVTIPAWTVACGIFLVVVEAVQPGFVTGALDRFINVWKHWQEVQQIAQPRVAPDEPRPPASHTDRFSDRFPPSPWPESPLNDPNLFNPTASQKALPQMAVPLPLKRPKIASDHDRQLPRPNLQLQIAQTCPGSTIESPCAPPTTTPDAPKYNPPNIAPGYTTSPNLFENLLRFLFAPIFRNSDRELIH